MSVQLHNFAAVLFLMLFCLKAEAQDTRFSQFYAAPMHLNPAMTGVFDGQWRTTLNYRDQWASILQDVPYRTFGAGFDMRLNVLKNDYFAFGFNFLSDQAGDARFRQTKGHLSLSYLKQLTGGYHTSQQYLIAGAQVGAGQHRLDFDNLWTTSQFNLPTETLDTSQPTGENFNTSNNAYLDVNIGLLWYAIFDDNFSMYAGGAMNHINAPQISLIENSDATMPMRWIGHIGGEIPFTDELSILPAIAVMGQSSANSYTFGANMRYSNHDWRELAVRIGAWIHVSNKMNETNIGRHNDALIFAAIMELERFNLGISYDINTSSLVAATNSRGTVELSFIYTHPESQRVRVQCPNF